MGEGNEESKFYIFHQCSMRCIVWKIPTEELKWCRRSHKNASVKKKKKTFLFFRVSVCENFRTKLPHQGNIKGLARKILQTFEGTLWMDNLKIANAFIREWNGLGIP